MQYELIVLDLDGTLTNSKKEITPPTREALIEIQKAGKKVVLASGRPDSGVIPLAKELQMDQYGGYILTYNGGKICQCGTGKLIYNKQLPPDIIRPVYEMLMDYTGVDLITYSDTKLYSGICANQYTELEARVCFLPLIPVADFANAIRFPVNKLLIGGEHTTLLPILKQLQEKFPDTLSCYFSDPFFINVMPLNIDKAASLKTLLDHLHLTPGQMICCGDGYNDVDMIKYAGLGVAMENAVDIVKEAADFITRSNDEDGVLHVINRFMRD